VIYLGAFELLTLLAIAQLEGDAYGVTIRDLLETETSRTTIVRPVPGLRRYAPRLPTCIGSPGA
jgi:hypothetical protein